MTNEPVDETYVYYCGFDGCPKQMQLSDDLFFAIMHSDEPVMPVPNSGGWWFYYGDYICPDCAKRNGLVE